MQNSRLERQVPTWELARMRGVGPALPVCESAGTPSQGHSPVAGAGKAALGEWKFRFTARFKIGSCPMGPDPVDAKLKCRGRSRGEESMSTPPSEGSASE